MPPADPTLQAHSTLISLLLQGLSPWDCPSLTSAPGTGLVLHQKTMIVDGGGGERGLRVIIKDSGQWARALVCRGAGVGGFLAATGEGRTKTHLCSQSVSSWLVFARAHLEAPSFPFPFLKVLLFRRFKFGIVLNLDPLTH